MSKRRSKRPNPLLAVAPVVRKHTMGSAAGESVESTFRYQLRKLSPPYNDIYTGVSVTREPFVALAYALSWRKKDLNDWGLEDIEDPGVLLAFGELPDRKLSLLDADLMVTAQDLLRESDAFAKAFQTEWIEDGGGDFDSYADGVLGDLLEEWAGDHAGLDEVSRDASRSEHYEHDDPERLLEDMTVSGIAGDYGNRPDPGEMRGAIVDLAIWRLEVGDVPKHVAAQKALEMAGDIVPQRRYLGDILNLAGFVIVPGFADGGYEADWQSESLEMSDFRESGCQPLNPTVVFHSFSSLEAAGTDLLDVAFELGCVYDSNGRVVTSKARFERLLASWEWWHGTNLSNASSAFPEQMGTRNPASGLRNYETYAALVWKGSYRCDLDDEDEDEDED